MSSLRVSKTFVFINIISYCLYFFSELIKIRPSKHKVSNKDPGTNRVSLLVKTQAHPVMMYFTLASLNLNVHVKILFFKMHKLKMNLLIVTSCWDLDVFPPKNGKRIGDDFSIGSTVTFSCDEGYELDGESKLTCRPDGQWSDHPPLCKGTTKQRAFFASRSW